MAFRYSQMDLTIKEASKIIKCMVRVGTKVLAKNIFMREIGKIIFLQVRVQKSFGDI